MTSNVKPLREPVPTDVPAMGFSYQFQVVDGISMVFQTHLDQTSAKEDIDELCDRVASVAERQKAKLELPEVRRHYGIAVTQLEIAERDYVNSQGRFEAIADASPRREKGITAQQRTTLDNLKTSIDRLHADVRRWESEIAKREAIVNGKNQGV